MQNSIRIYRGDCVIHHHDLNRGGVAIGPQLNCDVVLQGNAPSYWIAEGHGSVWLHTLDAGAYRNPEVLPCDKRVPLSEDYALQRIQRRRPQVQKTQEQEHRCDHAQEDTLSFSSLRVIVGQGPSARCLKLCPNVPTTIGCADSSSITLVDKEVDALHCSLEPHPKGIRLRDFDSLNGTWMEGARVDVAILRPGARWQVGRTRLQLIDAEEALKSKPTFVRQSLPMQQVWQEVQRYAALSWPGVIMGDSGVGKEQLAHTLHRLSARSQRPYVALNAASIPQGLVESELFGHLRGAFTGADTHRAGVFEQAHQGTLFLDEIGELPLALQAQLLRVLENGEVRRVGDTQTRHVDVL